MTPGSILLGNIGQPFECSHEHSNGDRCISFGYAPDYYDRFGPRFRQVRIPAIRSLAPFVAAAFRAVRDTSGVSWEEMSVALAERTVRATTEGTPKRNPASASDVARVIDATRMIEENRHDALSLNALAERAGLSAYHFLRVFERVTGTTPHQYRLRARLRAAALRLTDGRAKVIDVALDSGFGDVSNFNRAFRAEFGVGPRRYRQRYLSSPPRL